MVKQEANDSAYVGHSKEHARKRFISQGALSEISATLGSGFIVPFAKEITRNTASLVGVLSAFSGLLSPLGNLWGNKLMERYSRRTIHLRYTLLQALVFLPIIAIPFLFWNNIATTSIPLLLVIFYSLFVFFSGVKDPSSFSWLGDLVPENERGKYFARRNRIIGLWGLSVFLVAGIALRYFESRNLVLASITVLFVFSLILRVVSYFQVKHIFSPHFKLAKSSYFSFWSFLRRYDNFGKFAMFQAVFSFSIMFASPFFSVYMLEDLHFNLLTFTIVSLSSTAFYLLFTPLAGKFSDKYGNVRLLWIAGFTFPLSPLFWLFLKNPLWLILIPNLMAGIANAALTIGTTNFTYDAVTPQKRGLCVSYLNLLSGIGIFLGSIAGGLMINYAPLTFHGSTTLFVFAAAVVLRFATSLIFLPQISEARKAIKIKGLSWDVLHPFRTVRSDVVWFRKFVREK